MFEGNSNDVVLREVGTDGGETFANLIRLISLEEL